MNKMLSFYYHNKYQKSWIITLHLYCQHMNFLRKSLEMKSILFMNCIRKQKKMSLAMRTFKDFTGILPHKDIGLLIMIDG